MKQFDAASVFAGFVFTEPNDFTYKLDISGERSQYEIKHKTSGVTIAFMCDDSHRYGPSYTLMEGLELSFKHVSENTFALLRQHTDVLLKQKQLEREVEVDNLVIQEVLKNYPQKQ